VADSRFTGWGTTQITWDFDSTLLEATSFDVEIPVGAFLDADGNTWAGTIEGTLNFTTGDPSPPKLGTSQWSLGSHCDGYGGCWGSSTGTPNAEEVPVESDIVLNFDSTVSTVAGNITIHRYADGSTIETIPVTSSQVTGSGTSTITVNPANNLPKGTTIYVSIDSGAFVDDSGNAFVGDFQRTGGDEIEAGAYPDFLRFTTIDDSDDLVLVSSVPADGATGVEVDTTIVLNFDQNACESNFSGGTVAVHNAADGSLVHHARAYEDGFSGENTPQLTITLPESLTAGTGYYVIVPYHSFTANCVANSAFAGITDPTVLNFTTASDTDEPTLISTTPTTGATGVATDTNIVLTFIEPVIATTGNITIYKTSDGSTVETLPVISSQVTGSGTTQITINPSADLSSNTSYYINIDATAFDDTDGNPYAGIAGHPANCMILSGMTSCPYQTLQFTTVDLGAPTLVSSTPADGAVDVALTRPTGGMPPEFKLTFSESVCVSSTGNVTIRYASDGSIFKQFTVSGSHMSGITAGCSSAQVISYWNMVQAYPAGTAFYVTIAPGTFQDAAGNPYPGISDTTTLNFTTTEQTDTTPPAIYAWMNMNGSTVTASFSEMVVGSCDGGGCANYVAESPDAPPSEAVGGQQYTYNREGENGPYVDIGYRRYSNATSGYWENGFWHRPPLWLIIQGGWEDLAGNVLPDQVIPVQLPPPSPQAPSWSAPTVTSVTATSVTVAIPSEPAGYAMPAWWHAMPAWYERHPYGESLEVLVQTDPADWTGLVQYCKWTFDNVPWGGEYTQACAGGEPADSTWKEISDLEPATTYHVQLRFSGLGSRDETTSYTSFTTLNADGSIAGLPTLVSSTPADNATDVAVDSNITLVFSEAVYRYGNITIHNAATGATVETITIADNVPGSGTTTITVNPSGDFEAGTGYYINIDPTAFDDNSGNSYSGIADATTLNFTTSTDSLTPPTLPIPTVQSVTATAATFTLPSKPVGYDNHGESFGWEIVSSCVGGLNTASQSWPYDNVPWGTTVTAQGLSPDSGSYGPPANCYALRFYLYSNWNSNPVYPPDNAYFNTPSADTTSPTLVSSTPADDATDVDGDTNITLVFSEPVYWDVVGGAQISIYRGDVTGSVPAEVFATNSSRVSGIGTNTITIDPGVTLGSLDAGLWYFLHIQPDALQDAAGNRFAGITNIYTLSFTTPAAATSFPSSLAAPVMTNISWNIFTFQTVYPVGLDCTIGYQYGFDLYRGFSNASLTYNWDTSACGTSTPEFPPVTRYGWEDSSDIANHRFSWGEGGSWVPASGSVIQPGQSHSVRAWVSDNLGNKISSPFTEFTTLSQPDNQAPTLTAKWPFPGCGPEDGCYSNNNLYQCSSVLELTFSEPVFSAAPGEWTWDPGLNPAYGLIQVYNVSVSGSYAQWNGAGGDSITVSGLGSNTLHLVMDDGMCVSSNPRDFGARIAPNALKDAAGNTFSGITGYYDWSWNIVNPPRDPWDDDYGQYSYPPGYSSP
jgi:methionine-rich copper-binding protein CopC